MNFRFDHPEYLLLLLLAAPIVWLGMRSLAALEPVRRWTAIALRLAVLLVLTLMLAGMQGVRKHTDLTVMVVRDESESVRRLAKPPDGSAGTMDEWISRYVEAASSRNRRQTDRLGVVTYDDRAIVRTMPSEASDLDLAATVDPREGTDSATALRSAMAIFPADTAGRLLLITDGNDTRGDLLAAAREAAAAGLKVDVLPITYSLDNEVMVDAVYAPTDAREGQTAGLRIVLRATRPATGVLRLLHDDNEVGGGYNVTTRDWSLESEDAPASSQRPASPDAGVSSASSQHREMLGVGGNDPAARYIAVKQIDLPLAFSGVNRFRAIFEPDPGPGSSGSAVGGAASSTSGGDTVAVNNRADAFTLVSGEGRVLLVSAVPDPAGSILPRALRSRNINVDVIDPYAFPTRIGELQRYDAVLFQDVEQAAITAPQQRMLAQYVNDMGGGFVMIGGRNSFAAGAWTNTPVDRILPVECQVPSQAQLPSGALVIVIDRSGSMGMSVGGTNRTQQELANEAAVLAINTLFPQDLIGVVVFDTQAQWIVKVQPNSDPAGITSLVRSVNPGGGTDVYSGLIEAYKALAPMDTADAAIRHVILLTDGESAPPPGGSYVKLVADMVRADISLSTVGVGDGHNSQLLNQLAQMGGGTYHPITNPQQLPQVFIKEAKTIRKNLIKEVTFTPAMHATGSPIMTNVAGVPDLRGFVLTGPKHDPRVFMPLTGPEGEPIFAHWQVGLGRTAAYTSDAHNRWAVDWVNWDGYADFWARTVRTVARPAASRNADLVADIRGDNLSVRLDTAADTEAGFAKVMGSVLQPDGSVQAVELEQTGPGLYETNLPAEQSGNYVVSLFVQRPGGEREAVFGGVSRPPGAELRRFRTNLPLLQQVADVTGGRVLDPLNPQAGDLFTRAGDTFVTRSVRPLWRQLLVLLLALILLDVACRRIAWDAAAIANWVRDKFGVMFGRREVQAEATLAALKQRQAQLRTTTTRAPSGVEDAPARTRKFEADLAFVAKGNVAEAVGGAGASTPEYDVPTRREVEEAVDEASTTGRLLAAKRRARIQDKTQK